MPARVFDTTILLRMLLPSQRDGLADALWQECEQSNIDVVMPSQGISAKRFNRPTTYDSEFFALAAQLRAELWTADEAFVNAMGRHRPRWVKRLAEFTPVSQQGS